MTPKAMRQWSTQLQNEAFKMLHRVNNFPAEFSSRAIDEAQGYARALRQVAARLERTANAEIAKAERVKR